MMDRSAKKGIEFRTDTEDWQQNFWKVSKLKSYALQGTGLLKVQESHQHFAGNSQMEVARRKWNMSCKEANLWRLQK